MSYIFISFKQFVQLPVSICHTERTSLLERMAGYFKGGFRMKWSRSLQGRG